MSMTKGAAIADRAPLFALSGPSHLQLTYLRAPFRQRGLVASDRAQTPRATDIIYGICVGLVAEWIRLHSQFRDGDEHTRTKTLVTSSIQISILAQVAYINSKAEDATTASKGAISAALKKAKVGRTISAGSPSWFHNIRPIVIEEFKAFLTAQVSSQNYYYIFVLYFDYGVDGHAVAAFHENTAAGGALRVFEPNIGELLVPYSEFGTFWTDMIAQYRGYRDSAGVLAPKELTSIAVHTLRQ
jgi:hypothetical protein